MSWSLTQTYFGSSNETLFGHRNHWLSTQSWRSFLLDSTKKSGRRRRRGGKLKEWNCRRSSYESSTQLPFFFSCRMEVNRFWRQKERRNIKVKAERKSRRRKTMHNNINNGFSLGLSQRRLEKIICVMENILLPTSMSRLCDTASCYICRKQSQGKRKLDLLFSLVIQYFVHSFPDWRETELDFGRHQASLLFNTLTNIDPDKKGN